MFNFNAETFVPEANEFTPIPAGEYEGIITATEIKSTKDGRGKYLELTTEVQGGQFQGRRIWDRLNFQNDNAKAVAIAMQQLQQVCFATNVLQVNEGNMHTLCNRPIVVKVSCEPMDRKDPNSRFTNNIKGYKAKAANQAQAGFVAPRVAAAPQAPAAAQQQAPAASAPALPWMTQKAA